ncbi:MAG: hypothetical protein ACYDHH_19940 [Solirubrobacteraceae bacterium]
MLVLVEDVVVPVLELLVGVEELPVDVDELVVGVDEAPVVPSACCKQVAPKPAI